MAFVFSLIMERNMPLVALELRSLQLVELKIMEREIDRLLYAN